jgi:hypothetical protein
MYIYSFTVVPINWNTFSVFKDFPTDFYMFLEAYGSKVPKMRTFELKKSFNTALKH